MKPVDGKRHKKTISRTPRPRRPPPPKAATWDQQKPLDPASKGVGPSDIASVVSVSHNTVRLYLQRVVPELEALQGFRNHLGDSLALTLAKWSDVEDKLLDALNDETVLSTLTP